MWTAIPPDSVATKEENLDSGRSALTEVKAYKDEGTGQSDASTSQGMA